jgi:hypothetical protein
MDEFSFAGLNDGVIGCGQEIRGICDFFLIESNPPLTDQALGFFIAVDQIQLGEPFEKRL